MLMMAIKFIVMSHIYIIWFKERYGKKCLIFLNPHIKELSMELLRNTHILFILIVETNISDTVYLIC